MQGDITTEYTVWCGYCVEWYQETARNKRAAIYLFRLRGWGMKKGKWCCPHCNANK